MTYFKQNYGSVRLPFKTDANPGLRYPQIAAVHALAAHILSRREPGIVSMPTGTGKTAVLMLTPFFARARRVLVLTPSQLVRNQIAEELSSLRLLKALGCVDAGLRSPTVVEVRNRCRTTADWKALEHADVVVATPFTTSPALGDVAPPPVDLFDLLLVDEAHHSPARSWKSLLAAFPDAHKALFTATPFREDRREIRGRFVYTYSLEQAFRDGLFGHIRYIPVAVDGEVDPDITIAQEAERVLRADQAAGYSHFLMVRTDSKTRADQLYEVYERNTGLRLWVVHSGHSFRRVKDAVKKLRGGELDGIICVDMFGEGFDFPNLKIAAVHAPHKSLAITLQFVGRFARVTGDKLGEAKFLAVPSEIEVERTRLFEESAVWEELIINVGAGRVRREEEVREALATFETVDVALADDEELSLYSLEPMFHVKILEADDGIDLESEIVLPSSLEVVHRRYSSDLNCLVLITRQSVLPRWSVSSRFASLEYDLIVVYHDVVHRLLFICSSVRTESIYGAIAQAVRCPYSPLPAPLVDRVLRDLERPEFFNIGMRNRLHASPTESYRIMTGPSAQAAITRSDGRMYHRGHVFGRGQRGSELVTIGYSSAAKVWCAQSGQIPDLIRWCQSHAEKIRREGVVTTASALDFLPAGIVVKSVPSAILAVEWAHDAYLHPYQIIISNARVPLVDVTLEVEPGDRTSGVLVKCQWEDVEWMLAYNPGMCPVFKTVGGWGDKIYVHRGRDVERLIDWVNTNPLHFYLADGSALCGRSHVPCSYDREPFDREAIVVGAWEASGVEITWETPEAVIPRSRKISVHEALRAWLLADGVEHLFYDHGSGETCDFVGVWKETSRTVVRLYHCKGSSESKPGSRVEDVYEVCGQAVKCLKWLRNHEFFLRRLQTRHVPPRRAFVKGSLRECVRLLRKGTVPITYEVAIVQPGLSKGAAQDAVLNVLAAADDYVRRTTGHRLIVIGSN